MTKINVVISGFGPYEDLSINPSYEVPLALEHAKNGDLESDFGLPEGVEIKVKSVMLPISFANAWPQLLDTINAQDADIVIATGVKHADRGVQLERCATNIMDANKPDVDNRTPQSVQIVENGPAAYWTRLPLRMILNDFAHSGIASTLSSDAGTYVCNSLFYRLLDWASNNSQKRIIAGFVSFPPVVALHDARHGLPLDAQIKAGKSIICEAVKYYMKPSSLSILLE